MTNAERESLRLFYALWPDPQVRAALNALQAPLQGRLTRAANLHITLAFLGSQPASRLPVLRAILDGLPNAAIELTLDRVGYFARHRIAWAGLQSVPPALAALHTSLHSALAQHAIEFERQAKFKPHVTLARDSAPAPGTSCQPILWQARQVALIQSSNEVGGVSYKVLASRDLR